MEVSEIQQLKHTALFTVLSHHFLKKANPERTGPTCLEINDFLKAIGVMRLSAELEREIRHVVEKTLEPCVDRMYYDDVLREYTIYFNEKIAIEYPFVFLGTHGHKIPEHMQREFNIKSPSIPAEQSAPRPLPQRPPLQFECESYSASLPSKASLRAEGLVR